ncbi:putative 1-acyl-sn-glycerol-3-phosphate acyltransferase 2-like [Capsicum annuum]|nr:putative 1-acyl-sn-glycerol-3-phosphate acyltransferase 2-like [Capsicum annuum]
MAGSSIFNAFFIVFFVTFFSAMAETSAQELAPAPAPDAGAAFAMPSSGLLVGTSLLLYSTRLPFIDYMAGIVKVKVLPIGTLVQDPMASVDGNIEIMERLGKKEKFSTIRVSFWEWPFLDKTRIGRVIRVGDRGMVMGGWAPQAKILTHSSIDRFVSHCGWNSISESIDYGIPTIAMPMNLDQPMNAKLLVEIGVALEVLRDENGAFYREDIARVIKDVICGKLGENLRTKNVEDINV